MDPAIRMATAADRTAITRLLRDSWGSTTVVVHATARDASMLPALVAERENTLVGLLTYEVSGDGLEIVTLDALTPRVGIGTRLLAGACDVAREHGLERIWLATTNDNLDALRFYQRRGLRIVAIAPGSVDAARLIKPEIPAVGDYGIEIRDELILQKLLT